MKFGIRKPSLKRRLAARTSLKRYIRHNLGFKAPRGMGWLTNPKKAAYNRVYNRTSFGIEDLFKSKKANKKGIESSSIGSWLLLLIIVFIVIVIVALK